MNTAKTLLIAVLCAYVPVSPAAQVVVTMHRIDSTGVGKSIGTVRVEDSKDGLVLTPRLEGLPPGVHGFHVHDKPDCAPMEKDGVKTAGLAAGGHYDPDKTGTHAGPTGKGHLGDLPVLTVDSYGMATQRLVAQRLKVADLVGRSLMIHEGGDNYADEPKPLGGGGARIACGVVEK